MRHTRLLLAGALLLTACGQGPAAKMVDAQAARGDQSAGSGMTATEPTRYTCADGSVVEARYLSDDTAQLRYRGQTIDMKIAVSASGARYVGGGWQWWTKGLTEGTLSPLEPGEEIALAAGVVCTAQ